MELVVTIAFGLLALFVIGRLAAMAVPGPDPMPAWLTILIGFAATVVGGGIGYAAGGGIGFIAGATIVGAMLIVLYRRLVQKRGITGDEAFRYPTRGFGIAKIRRRMGIDQLPEGPDRQLAYLETLYAEGILTSEELEQKRELVRARTSGRPAS